MLVLLLGGCALPPGVGQKNNARDDLDHQAPPAGVRPAALAALKAGRPYPYPLQPGTRAWNRAEPYDRVDSVVIPRTWREAATSWQLFCSAITNPYFDVLWPIGDSIMEAYDAARSSVTLSILKEVEAKPDFGANTLRFLAGFDLRRTLSDDSDNREPCVFDYMNVCHMAGLEAALKTLDDDAKVRLLDLAAWDAYDLLLNSNTICATAPIRLMYRVYGSLSTHSAGLTLIPLSSEQSWQLDRGFLPSDLVPVIRSTKEALALISRPKA